MELLSWTHTHGDYATGIQSGRPVVYIERIGHQYCAWRLTDPDWTKIDPLVQENSMREAQRAVEARL